VIDSDSCNNGLMESLWARMQVDLLNQKRWNTRLEVANVIIVSRTSRPEIRGSRPRGRRSRPCRNDGVLIEVQPTL
jgi:hypothetical protein